MAEPQHEPQENEDILREQLKDDILVMVDDIVNERCFRVEALGRALVKYDIFDYGECMDIMHALVSVANQVDKMSDLSVREHFVPLVFKLVTHKLTLHQINQLLECVHEDIALRETPIETLSLSDVVNNIRTNCQNPAIAEEVAKKLAYFMLQNREQTVTKLVYLPLNQINLVQPVVQIMRLLPACAGFRNADSKSIIMEAFANDISSMNEFVDKRMSALVQFCGSLCKSGVDYKSLVDPNEVIEKLVEPLFNKGHGQNLVHSSRIITKILSILNIKIKYHLDFLPRPGSLSLPLLVTQYMSKLDSTKDEEAKKEIMRMLRAFGEWMRNMEITIPKVACCNIMQNLSHMSWNVALPMAKWLQGCLYEGWRMHVPQCVFDRCVESMRHKFTAIPCQTKIGSHNPDSCFFMSLFELVSVDGDVVESLINDVFLIPPSESLPNLLSQCLRMCLPKMRNTQEIVGASKCVRAILEQNRRQVELQHAVIEPPVSVDYKTGIDNFESTIIVADGFLYSLLDAHKDVIQSIVAEYCKFIKLCVETTAGFVFNIKPSLLLDAFLPIEKFSVHFVKACAALQLAFTHVLIFKKSLDQISEPESQNRSYSLLMKYLNEMWDRIEQVNKIMFERHTKSNNNDSLDKSKNMANSSLTT